ncbi:MAG TPA: hypothetical protein VGH81_08225 [Rudaea sp.]|jgi:hypothetical protein
MNRISSKAAFFLKRIFPIFWFGFLLVFVAIDIFSGIARTDPVFLIMPFAMAIFGFFLMRKLVWDLADEVTDHGSYLRVRRGSVEDRVDLANIMNVSSSLLFNPPRVTLRLITPGRFGKEIVFSPIRPFTLIPFAKNPVVEDLIERVYRARSGASG